MKLTERLNSLRSETVSLAKLHPVIFISALFGIVYGLVNIVISVMRLSFYIGITGSYSLILGICKFYALKKLLQTRRAENAGTVKSIEENCTKKIAFCTGIMSFLHFSFAIVSTFFYSESPESYDFLFITFISGAAIVKIVLASVQSVRTKKNRGIIIHYVKLVDLANALISIALTQRAILYYTGDMYAKMASGAGGIFFSICAGFVCLSMFIGYRKRRIGTP